MEAEGRYGAKALQPALADFAKIYYWYYPWILTRRKPDAQRPVTFGGYYDIVYYPLLVTRTEPGGGADAGGALEPLIGFRARQVRIAHDRLALAAGGVTQYELLSGGVPTVSVPHVAREEAECAAFGEAGAVVTFPP